MRFLERRKTLRKPQAVSWELSYSYKSCITLFFFSYIYTRSPFVFLIPPRTICNDRSRWSLVSVLFFLPFFYFAYEELLNKPYIHGVPGSSFFLILELWVATAFACTIHNITRLHQYPTRCDIRAEFFIVVWTNQKQTGMRVEWLSMISRRTGGLSRD